MKKHLLIVILIALAFIRPMSSAPEKPVTRAGDKKPIVVPSGRIYVIVNAKKKEIARYSAGKVMAQSAGDCVKVDCPSTFNKNITCWNCKGTTAPTPPPKARQP